MESNEVTKMSNRLAIAIKKAGKKAKDVKVDIEEAKQVANACAVLGRIVKLAEADAELASPDLRLTGSEAGRAEVWRLVMQELDYLDMGEKDED